MVWGYNSRSVGMTQHGMWHNQNKPKIIQVTTLTCRCSDFNTSVAWRKRISIFSPCKNPSNDTVTISFLLFSSLLFEVSLNYQLPPACRLIRRPGWLDSPRAEPRATSFRTMTALLSEKKHIAKLLLISEVLYGFCVVLL